MHLVVGLGNPGRQYAGNRHNVGFMVLDRLAEKLGAGPLREKFRGLFAQKGEVGLLAPQTYMNLSGESVQKAMQFYKVELSDVIVVHDELDLPFRTVRIKLGGGAAGHNGLRSMIQHCGGPDFVRVRVGISRPKVGAVESYVLGDFDTMERAELPDVLEQSCKCVQAVIANGVGPAMNAMHGAQTEQKKQTEKKKSGNAGKPAEPGAETKAEALVPQPSSRRGNPGA